MNHAPDRKQIRSKSDWKPFGHWWLLTDCVVWFDDQQVKEWVFYHFKRTWSITDHWAATALLIGTQNSHVEVLKHGGGSKRPEVITPKDELDGRRLLSFLLYIFVTIRWFLEAPTDVRKVWTSSVIFCCVDAWIFQPVLHVSSWDLKPFKVSTKRDAWWEPIIIILMHCNRRVLHVILMAYSWCTIIRLRVWELR